MSKIKLYTDENIHAKLAPILRQHGFNVISALEVHKLSKSDIEQIKYSIHNKRSILTHNFADFSVLNRKLISEKIDHYVIILTNKFQLLTLLKSALNLLKSKSQEDLKNQIIWI